MVTARGASLVCVLAVAVAVATVAGSGFVTATASDVTATPGTSGEQSESALLETESALLETESPVPETTANAPSSTDGLLLASTALIGQQSLQEETEDDAENETPRHQNPDEYDGGGDQDGLQQWLGDRLADRLAGSTIALSDGQYDLARSYLDDEYRDLAGQYVEVADEEDDEPNGFETAQEEQAELIDTLEEYDEVREAYEQAQAAGDEREARQHARRLLELGIEIEALVEDIDDQHTELDEETDGNLGDSRDGLDSVTQDVQADRIEIRSEQFVETTLELSSADETISFLDPLSATGELRTVNGSPVANEPVRLEIGNQTLHAETDSDGTFDIEYRPTALPLETTEIAVEAAPANESIYLESEATVDVSIEQTEPTIPELRATQSAAYGETLSLEGTISVEAIPVDAVPIAVTLEGEWLGTVTAENGSFEGEFSMPRAVPAGNHDLEVALAFDDRALASTRETTEITVRETETALSIDKTVEGDDAHLTGTLETVDGEAVENQSLTVEIDGSTVASVSTDGDGHFEETLEGVSTTDGERTLSVTYEDAGSNLADSHAELTLGTTGSPSSGTLVDVPTWAWGGLFLTAAIVGGWWYRRERRTATNRSVDAFTPTSTHGQEPPTDPRLISLLLSQASDALTEGRSVDAIQFSYGAVRRTVDPGLEARDRTHWEFFEQVSSEPTALDADELSLLYDLTAGYERATFDTEPIEQQRAQSLFEMATRLCNRVSSRANGFDGDGIDQQH
ncbi:hypothetical protein OB919_19055 [Halobacteria archaeon AArc-curdl1]|uniref:DUF4129 domain-containing protein n=1 Tax=Natronosalvus hydrolyticus TaxID=2979988 RepID=A0AAP2ZB91_9EURY|nr:hypothetical protein [Halobacteria archaeon AArc-curdl1]